MMKAFLSQQLVIFGLLLTLISLVPSPAAAHVLETDGSIGVVMHINPDDDPIAGQLSTFFFEFKDKDGKFSPSQCDCQIEISENNQPLVQQALFSNGTSPSLTSASFSYIFPEKNVYLVTITGQPVTSNLFQSFKMTYTVRVARQTAAASPTPAQPSHLWHYLLLGLLGLGILGLGHREVRQAKPSKQSHD